MLFQWNSTFFSQALKDNIAMKTRVVMVLAAAAAIMGGCKSSEESMTGVNPTARMAKVLQSGCTDEQGGTPLAQSRAAAEEWTDGNPEGTVLLTCAGGTLMGAVNHVRMGCSEAKSAVTVSMVTDADNNLEVEASFGLPFLGFPVLSSTCSCDYYGTFELNDFTPGKYHLRLYKSDSYERALYYDGTVTIQDGKVVVLQPVKQFSELTVEYAEYNMSALPGWLQKIVSEITSKTKTDSGDYAGVYQVSYNNGKNTGYVVSGSLVASGIVCPFEPGRARVFTNDGSEQRFATWDEYVEFAKGIEKWKAVYFISNE